MADIDLSALTEEVVSRFDSTPDARLRRVMQALVRHLHAFARDVELTEAEWFKAIEFLTATGQTCTPTRQEFILLSDVLGLSMLTVGLNGSKPAGCTEPTVFGPFYVADAPAYGDGEDVAHGAPGTPCTVRGTVRSRDGAPIANARIEVWQADDEGQYDVQKQGLEHAQARGVLHSRHDGGFHFRTIVAEPYPIPTDGPVGTLLGHTRRSPWRPAHLHFRISAPGYQTLVTHVFRAGDEHLGTDPVFGVRESLIAEWPRQADGSHRLDFDFVLNPDA